MPLKQLQVQVLLALQTGPLPISSANTHSTEEASLANDLLLPVLEAAKQLATGTGGSEGLDIASKLADSVCDVLIAFAGRGYEWAEVQLVYSELLQLLILLEQQQQAVQQNLQQQQQQANHQQQQQQQASHQQQQQEKQGQRKVWLAACAAAAGLAASAGDLEAVDLLLQQTKQLQLGSEGIAAVFSTALRSAAVGVSIVSPSPNSRPTVTHLWAKLPGLSAEMGEGEILEPAAAAAVACAMQADASLAEALLAEELPMQLLQLLLQGAVDAKQAVAVHLLLQQAEQQQQLDKLPAKLLTAAATLSAGGGKGGRDQQVQRGSELVGPAAAAAGGLSRSAPVASQLQLLEVLLQQGEAPPTVAAAALLGSLRASRSSPSTSSISSSSKGSSSASTSSGVGLSFAELLAWLQQQVSTAPAPAAYVFLCSILEASIEYLHLGQCWEIYDLLKQQQSAWAEEQQGLTAGACNALL